MDNNFNSSSSPAPVVQTALHYKWRFALSTIAAVGAVWYAAKEGKKGKFWYYIGGSMVGGAIGYLIDSAGE